MDGTAVTAIEEASINHSTIPHKAVNHLEEVKSGLTSTAETEEFKINQEASKNEKYQQVKGIQEDEDDLKSADGDEDAKPDSPEIDQAKLNLKINKAIEISKASHPKGEDEWSSLENSFEVKTSSPHDSDFD